jgi:hypothetical protein
MKIGDKVRMIHDTIEGVVTKIINDKQIEIEDTHGFNFPVYKTDLILVNPIEEQYFKTPLATKKEETSTRSDDFSQSTLISGYLHLALVSEKQNWGVYLLNKTNTNCLVTVFGVGADGHHLLFAQEIKKNEYPNLGLYPLSKLELYKSLSISWLPLLAKQQKKPLFKETLVTLKFSKLILAKDDILEIGKKGFITPLLEQATEVDLTMLAKKMTDEPSVSVALLSKTLEKPLTEIDLHAEALGIDVNLANSDILLKQVQVFKQKLENAIAHNFFDITFIHGVGNGVLKNEIYKCLQHYAEVDFFEDAQRSKFGYGATRIVLKP